MLLMFQNYFCAMLVAATLALAPTAGSAQIVAPNPNTKDSQSVGLRSLSDAVTSIIISLEGAEPRSNAYRALSLLRVQVEMLERRVSGRQFLIDPDNAALFEAYAKVFLEISRVPLDASMLQLVESATQDFSVKNQFVSSRAALLGRENSLLVEVTVDSVSDAGHTVAGYEVIATPVAMARQGIWLFPFSNLTNDAVRRVPPGLYEFRARRNGLVVGSNIFSVGERGAGAERKIILVEGRP